jgi:hypothetical protein
MPSWGRFLVGLAAIPGIVLAVLSVIAFVVSIAALLLLTLPVYSLVKGLSGSRSEAESDGGDVHVSTGRRHIDVKVVE